MNTESISSKGVLYNQSMNINNQNFVSKNTCIKKFYKNTLINVVNFVCY